LDPLVDPSINAREPLYIQLKKIKFAIVPDMRAETARIVETSFISTESFDQREFKRWVENCPPTDINHYELTNGRIVRTPPAGWGHGEIEARLVHILVDFAETNNLGRVFGSSTGLS
jgi:hypothetical protein